MKKNSKDYEFIEYIFSKRDNFRIKCITIIYQAEILDQKINIDEIFEEHDLSEEEFKILKWVHLEYENLQNLIITSQTKKWTWKRINPLLRSILLFGTFELFVRDKRVVINEIVKLTKLYVPDGHYKFVNAILDKICKGKYEFEKS